ncbi:MAG TPA: hypothetical protein VFV47_10325 [Hyphomicrobiaceae bacterium]|nr:hypothetical protein [Hyphomicrobiaceae bacterium]
MKASAPSTRLKIAALGAVAVLLSIGLAGKAWRYTARLPMPPEAIAAEIERRLVADGWLVDPAQSIKGGELGVPLLAFHKAGCDRLLKIAVVGRSAELTPFVQRALGPDTIVSQVGPAAIGTSRETSIRGPSAVTRVLDRLAAGEPQFLAISPDPSLALAGCDVAATMSLPRTRS